MSWVTIIWSMVASACLTLAVIHLGIWFKKRTAWTGLAFTFLAVATATMAAGEAWLMRSNTVGQYVTTLRWLHVPYWVLVVSLVAFTRLQLRAGRIWLAWTIVILRTASLLLNFLVGQNINYIEVTGLRQISFLGESVSSAKGVLNPWMLVAQLSLVLLVVFIADAATSAWRRGDRRSALVVGGSMVFFVFAAVSFSVMMFWLRLPLPPMNSVFYIAIIAAMSSDITREALRAGRLADDLVKSEARYRDIFEGSVEGIYRATLEGKLLAANPALAKILGYDSVEDVLSSVTDVGAQIWPTQEDRARFVRQLDEYGAALGYECQFKRKDGSLIWVSLSSRPVRRPDGRLAYADGFVEDINERKQAELALAESERRYRTLFEVTPVGLCVVGMDGYVRMANSIQARLYGYESPQQLEGFFASLFITEEDREQAGRNFAALIEGKDQAEWNFTAVRRDGSKFPMEVKAVVLRGSAGERQGYLILTRDLTKSIEDENEKNQLRLERTHLARVLTVDEISTSLAHEINQPLGAILNNAEAVQTLLARADDNREVLSEIIQDIIEDTRRAGDVVRKVRKVLKRGDAQVGRLSVNALIEETLEFLRNNLALNNITLRTELAHAIPDVWGDPIRLQQVLLNLVTNALEAMKDCPSRILTVRSSMDGPEMVTVSVGDSGPGIAEAHRESIFNPFFTTKKGGLGLGLSICRSIIEEHEGRIRTDDNPGGGATFSFSLKAWPENSA